MNTKRNGMIAAVGLALLILPSAAFAGFKPSAALQSACRGDAFRLCSGSLTSIDSVVACLRQKKSQATPGCQAQYDAEIEGCTEIGERRYSRAQILKGAKLADLTAADCAHVHAVKNCRPERNSVSNVSGLESGHRNPTSSPSTN